MPFPFRRRRPLRRWLRSLGSDVAADASIKVFWRWWAAVKAFFADLFKRK